MVAEIVNVRQGLELDSTVVKQLQFGQTFEVGEFVNVLQRH